MMTRDVSQAVNIDALRRLAWRRLPRVVFDYLDGGAEDEISLRANREAFEGLSLRPRILSGGTADLTTELFGRSYAAPFVLGPTGLNGLYWPQGDLHLARAAKAAGVGFALSTASNTSLEEIARQVSAPQWFQLYPWGTPDFSERLIARAAEAGYGALVLTVDSLVAGKRERDLRHGFSHEIRLTVPILLDGLRHPRWLGSVWMGRHRPRFENLAAFLGEGASDRELAEFTRAQRNPQFSWRDVRRIRRLWGGPLVIKGVMCAEDALRAREEGADGVVVSNHGGRQLDGAPASLSMLEEVAECLGADTTVLLDGGVRRGSDVVKALSLGAQGVLLGRAPLYGLAAAGQAGVTRALSILCDEMRRTMILTGHATTGALGAQSLVGHVGLSGLSGLAGRETAN